MRDGEGAFPHPIVRLVTGCTFLWCGLVVSPGCQTYLYRFSVCGMLLCSPLSRRCSSRERTQQLGPPKPAFCEQLLDGFGARGPPTKVMGTLSMFGRMVAKVGPGRPSARSDPVHLWSRQAWGFREVRQNSPNPETPSTDGFPGGTMLFGPQRWGFEGNF